MDRKLAAILAADVVGYSKLMEQDEQGTFEPRGPAATNFSSAKSRMTNW